MGKIGKIMAALLLAGCAATAEARNIYVHIAGDSVAAASGKRPRVGWGQALELYVKPGYEMVNRARSGYSTTAFRNSDRYEWKYLVKYVKPGDFLLIHFGHNNRHKNIPLMQYEDDLTFFVREGRKLGAQAVLITPVEEWVFKDGEFIGGKELKRYSEIVQDVAEAEKVPVIDLNKLSTELFTRLGPEESLKLFIPKDNSHFNLDGAKRIAELIIKDAIRQKLPLAAAFRDPDQK